VDICIIQPVEQQAAPTFSYTAGLRERGEVDRRIDRLKRRRDIYVHYR
jgi:hypothetical protein